MYIKTISKEQFHNNIKSIENVCLFFFYIPMFNLIKLFLSVRTNKITQEKSNSSANTEILHLKLCSFKIYFGLV